MLGRKQQPYVRGDCAPGVRAAGIAAVFCLTQTAAALELISVPATEATAALDPPILDAVSESTTTQGQMVMVQDLLNTSFTSAIAPVFNTSTTASGFSVTSAGNGTVPLIDMELGFLRTDDISGTFSRLSFSFTLLSSESATISSSINYFLTLDQDEFTAPAVEFGLNLTSDHGPVTGLDISVDGGTATAFGGSYADSRPDPNTSASRTLGISGTLTGDPSGTTTYTLELYVAFVPTETPALGPGISNDILNAGFDGFVFGAEEIIPEAASSGLLLGLASLFVLARRPRSGR